MNDIYRGKLVRLASESPETMSKSFVRWDHDTEAHRLVTSSPGQLWSEKKLKEFGEKNDDKQDGGFRFAIRTLDEDKLIGVVSLWVEPWAHGDAWLGIFIGERDYWGRGFGTDAMRVIVKYGFSELNLRRITLGVYSYNERALRSYTKVGFQIEGKVRGEGLRDGARYDCIYMGLLREDWKEIDQ